MNNDVIKLYRDGFTFDEIKRILGLNPIMVAKFLNRVSADDVSSHKKNIENRVRALKKKKNCVAIAKQLDLTVTATKKIMKGDAY